MLFTPTFDYTFYKVLIFFRKRKLSICSVGVVIKKRKIPTEILILTKMHIWFSFSLHMNKKQQQHKAKLKSSKRDFDRHGTAR